MKKMLVGLLAVFLFTFTACGVSVDAGTVTDKRVEDAWSEEVEITEEECEWDTDRKTVNGKTKTTREYECEDVGTGEYETVEHPAEYFITLEDKQGNDEEHNVEQEVYDSVKVGDFYNIKG